MTTRRTAAMDEAARAAVVRVCLAASPHAPSFSGLFSFLPPDGLHLLGHLHGELVSHAVVTTRWLQPEGLPLLRTAYVDAVATTPEEQGRGHGSAVMRALAATVADDYDIACLETERVGFYARLGWEVWRGPLAGRVREELIPTPGQEGILILQLPRTPSLDLDSLLTIDRQGARIW